MPILEKYWFTNPMNITPCKPHFVVHMLLMIMMAHLRPNREQEKLNHWRFFFSNNCSSVKPSKNEYQIEEGEGKKIPEGEIKGKMRT